MPSRKPKTTSSPKIKTIAELFEHIVERESEGESIESIKILVHGDFYYNLLLSCMKHGEVTSSKAAKFSVRYKNTMVKVVSDDE